MVARTCVLLLLAAGLFSCRSVLIEAQAGGELGPVKILLYAELKDATYGWLGDEPAPANIEPVTYSHSAGKSGTDLFSSAGGLIGGAIGGVMGYDAGGQAYDEITE